MQTSGKLEFKPNCVELIKANKNKDNYLSITTGDGIQAFKSKTMVESGPLQLQCVS